MDKQKAISIVTGKKSIYVKKRNNYEASKRVLDWSFAFAAFVLLFPFFIFIGLLIKIDSPADCMIFKQKRVGKNGKEFTIYKFRSMVPNAEELLEGLLNQNDMQGPIFKMKKDPRITRVGAFLRKTSLDELPQLWNVLKGEMSLVGPRPVPPREVEKYDAYARKRLSVIPGCTGLWQVSGRSNTSFEEMLKLDLDYLQNKSLWLDFKIVCKTFYVFLGSKDAY